jgi:coenzyme PQQ synthesis protein D (PqqD)
MRIAPHDIVRRAEDQVSTDLGDEIAILDVAGGQYFGLDGVGARVWSLLEEPRTLADLCAHITDEYDVDPTRCELDMIELIATLADEKLVLIQSTNLD